MGLFLIGNNFPKGKIDIELGAVDNGFKAGKRL
jgi:hypothetical protein